MGRNRKVVWIFPERFLVLPWPCFGRVVWRHLCLNLTFWQKNKAEWWWDGKKVPLKTLVEHMLCIFHVLIWEVPFSFYSFCFQQKLWGAFANAAYESDRWRPPCMHHPFAWGPNPMLFLGFWSISAIFAVFCDQRVASWPQSSDPQLWTRTALLVFLVHPQGSSAENISQQCSCLNAMCKIQHVWKYSVVKQADVRMNAVILLHSPPDQSPIFSLGIAAKVIPSTATV